MEGKMMLLFEYAYKVCNLFACRTIQGTIFIPLTLCILMDFTIHINTIRMGKSILCYRGHRLTFPNYDVSLSLRIVFTLTNSVGPDEMPHDAAFHLDLHFVGGRVVHSLLQLSERWSCHIWLVDRMKLASLESNLGGSRGLLIYPILLFSLPVSGRCPDTAEILLTGTLPHSFIHSKNPFRGFQYTKT